MQINEASWSADEEVCMQNNVNNLRSSSASGDARKREETGQEVALPE